VPVVSAVGHEVDVTVADLVADVRAATPTHAAEVVVPVRDDLLAALSALRGRLVRAEGQALGERRRVIRALRAELSDPRRVLSDQRRRLDEALHRVQAWSASTFRRESMRLAGLAARLEPANVGKILARGFALAIAHGRPLRSSAEAAPGDPVRVVLGEGWLDARVESRDRPPEPIPGLPARTEEA
jgi:exodeoxyribonuclease VII large subunit